MSIAAGFAVIMLVGAIAWQSVKKDLVAANPSHEIPALLESDSESFPVAENLPRGYSVLGSSILAHAILEYDKATKNGAPREAGIAAVKKYAENIQPGVSYKKYASSDIQTATDSSKDRVLAYRADLRVAFEPLLNNKDMELDLYAQYIDTKDAKYLAALRGTIANYRLAIANTEKVVAPIDAASYQAAILTALNQFSATLQAMADNADDPFASAALLNSYSGAQDNMLASFNAIGVYAAHKLL